jgi:EmrB/QacA subfamily drug resistance transporter
MLLPAGALGDRSGRRRALLAGLAVFGAGSVAAALTTTPAQLIAMRTVMGVGAAFIMPATLSLLAALFPQPGERARAIGIWSATSGLGVALGPTVGGYLLEHHSWSSIFWVNVPVVALALAGTVLLVPASRAGLRARLDLPGAVLATLAFTAVTYTVIEAPDSGWTSGTTIVRATASILLLAGFVGWELRSSHPMVDLSLFRVRAFAAANLSVAVLFFGLSGITFLATQILQFVLGYDTLAAGIRSLPSAIALMVAAPLGTRLAARFGVRTVAAAGLTMMAVGLALFTTAGAQSGYLDFLPGLVLVSAGLGLAMAPNTQAVMMTLPPAKTGVGSAITSTTRNLGGVIGVAVFGSVAGSLFTSSMSAGRLPGGPAATQSISAAATVAQHLPGPQSSVLLHAAAHSFVHATGTASWVGAAVTLATVPVAFVCLPRRGGRK